MRHNSRVPISQKGSVNSGESVNPYIGLDDQESEEEHEHSNRGSANDTRRQSKMAGKNNNEPLLMTGGIRSYNGNGDGNGDSNKDDMNIQIHRGLDDDPLLRQLPKELRKFVVKPEDNREAIEYVHRGALYSTLHSVLAVVCNVYSLCRMIVVQQGQIALTLYGDQQEILGPGRHVLLSPFNQFVGIRDITDAVIRHGPIHIIRVEIGQLGYGVDMEHGRPVLLSRGKHVIRSNTFVWKKFINLRERRTNLDQLEIVRVETGNIGYSYRQGKLVILEPGLHLIEPPDRFGDIMSTQMSILDLPLAVHETSDYVPLAIKSAVFYRIADPYKALVRIQNVSQQILETSVATLAGIIRSSSLSDVASRSQPFYHEAQGKAMAPLPGVAEQQSLRERKDDGDGDGSVLTGLGTGGGNPNAGGGKGQQQFFNSLAPPPPSAPPFFQHVHDEFLQSLHDHVLDEWGVEIQNIRIESLKINDARLQKDISAQAIDVSKQHNQYIMLQKKQEIVTVEAETRAAKIQIDTMADANKTRQTAQANADSMVIKAKAQRQVTSQQAQAEADAILIRAKATKQATELKGQGEAEYARLLEQTSLGRDLATMKIQADALSGLQQVAYVPHLNGLLSKGNGVFAADSELLMPKK